MLNIDIEQEGTKATVILEGMLNAHVAGMFKDRLNQIPADTTEVVVDCAKLRYTSSAGLRIILALQTRMDECKGTLVFKNVNPTMMEVFNDTGFSDFLNIE